MSASNTFPPKKDDTPGATITSAGDASTSTGTKPSSNAKAIDEFYKQELIREWERREQSRRIDAEYVNRRMPGGYGI